LEIKNSEKNGLPAKVFILTDGQISQEQEFVDFISQNRGMNRFFALGIGGGFSKSLIDKTAEAGRGGKAYCYDAASIASSCVKMIEDSFGAYYELYDFQFDRKLVKYSNFENSEIKEVPEKFSVLGKSDFKFQALLDSWVEELE
jgi:hypothetical protein